MTATPGEGAALSEDEREHLCNLWHSGPFNMLHAFERILAARAGAADTLRQAVEALADEWDAITGENATAIGTWRDAADDLRRVLDDNEAAR